MKETFDEYLQRLKDRRTEDDYKYSDEDFNDYIYHILDCYEKNISVYKCLEFMYFMKREPIQELGILEVPMPVYKKESLEEAVDKVSLLEFPIKEWYRSDDYNREEITAARDGFKRGAKWRQEQEPHNFLLGFVKQFDPKNGEIDGEEWSAIQLLQWLELNKFKIIK